MSAFLVGPDGALPLPWLGATLALAQRQRGHALLLHGGEGRGLFEAAMSIAQQRLCTHAEPAQRPCGLCDDCHLVQAQVHPDLRVLLPEALRIELAWQSSDDDESESKTKPSREIRIDDMRAAIDWATLSTARDRGKVLVVHPAARMNDTTANALLKTLEEPPGRLTLVLTAGGPRDLLPTIASRCQHVHVPVPDRGAVLAWLESLGVADAEILLRAAGEPLSARDLAARGVDAAAWMRVPAAVRRGDAAAFAGWTLPDVIDALCKLCHDTMCVSAGSAPRYFDAAAVPRGASWADVRQWSIDLTLAVRHADHPWHAGLAVDALLARASRVFPKEPMAKGMPKLGAR